MLVVLTGYSSFLQQKTTYHYNIAKILLNVALNTITLTPTPVSEIDSVTVVKRHYMIL